MRIANLAGRLAILRDGGAIDVHKASDGGFDADPQRIYHGWDDFLGWAANIDRFEPQPFDPQQLESPAPLPAQVFAIGLNYQQHADESGFGSNAPDAARAEPPVFTKFPSSITGPYGTVRLPDEGHTDWEVELVVIIGRRAHGVSVQDAWAHVAGLAVGQDLSERKLQMAATPPQFSLAKSFPGFSPIGPWLVTVDELADPDDLELGCAINGEPVQRARTSELIFSVPELIAKLSEVIPLLPGDVVFTGTPGGVGMARDPQRWLTDGDVLTSYVTGIGELRHSFTR
jgi:2-keto-4-pentenoate hydratase/2-oxohepta-3-ene-1,7-dioic acid hydratase in catechol pathway